MTPELEVEKDISTTRTATEWKFTKTTTDGWNAMLDGIQKATSSIDFEQFNLYPDVSGRRFVDALIERAKNGVKVRLLVDSMGSILLSQSTLPEEMQKAGIQVRFFNWITPFSKGNKRVWFFRNHRRALIIDQNTAFIGGICIGDDMRDWRDTMLEIKSSQFKIEAEATGIPPTVIEQMQVAFEATWKKAHRQSLRMNPGQSRIDADGFTFLTHAPLPRQRYLYYRLVEILRAASQSIYISTPYFLPDHKILRVLILAKRRGVDVRLLVPEHSDHPIVDRGSHSYYHSLLKHKVRIYRYKNMTHSKTVTIDGDSAVIGSLNLDSISLRYNFESGIISTNKQFAKELEDHFHEDILNANELTLEEWNSRGFMAKLLEWCVWPIRKFL